MPYRARGAFRLARVALHLAWGSATVAFAYPVVSQARRRGLKQRWSHQLLVMLGVDLRTRGPAARPGELLVANHISWLDVFVINAVAPCAFVCKSEVRTWPLVGWLCRHTDTVFIDRGRRRSARDTVSEIVRLLAAGTPVALFPEGTTSDGSELGEFRPALFQAAVDARSQVVPVAVSYRDRHYLPSKAASYVGDTSLLASLWRIACARSLCAEIDHLPRLAGASDTRTGIAYRARECLHARLDASMSSPDRVHGQHQRSAAHTAPHESSGPALTGQVFS